MPASKQPRTSIILRLPKDLIAELDRRRSLKKWPQPRNAYVVEILWQHARKRASNEITSTKSH